MKNNICAFCKQNNNRGKEGMRQIMEENKKDLIESLKVLLIYGKRKVDGVYRDGSIDQIYKYEDDIPHLYHMKNFLINHFLDVKELQDCTTQNNVNSIFYEIQKLGHIIFAETSRNSKSKSGLIYLPESISDRQVQTLEEFIKQLELENYKIAILTNLFRAEDGVLMGTQQIGTPNILKDMIGRGPER